MVRVTSFSEAGGRVDNEDAFAVHRHAADPDCWLGLLADGQGGSGGGAEAARLACRTAAEAALRQLPHELAKPSAWLEILRQADRAVAADPEAGFTTLVGFCIRDGLLAGASSGDSAALVVSNGEPARYVTSDQLKNPPVGSGRAAVVAFSARLVRPWSVLAMSDGVWKYAGWERLVRAAAGSRGAALLEALQAAARLPRSGQFPDDFTIVAFEDDA